LPHHAAPARLEGALDIVRLVGRRRGGQPERVRRFDADEIVAKVSHGVLLFGQGGGNSPSPPCRGLYPSGRGNFGHGPCGFLSPAGGEAGRAKRRPGEWAAWLLAQK